MAAFFVSTTGVTIRHIGENSIGSPVEDISMVQLDGHELEYVREQMLNVRMHKQKRVVKFYGDDAKFIAANW